MKGPLYTAFDDRITKNDIIINNASIFFLYFVLCSLFSYQLYIRTCGILAANEQAINIYQLFKLILLNVPDANERIYSDSMANLCG